MKNFIIKLLGGFTKEELLTQSKLNIDPKNLESSFYWVVPTYKNDKLIKLLFTDRELNIAIRRSERNPEDVK